MSLLVISEIVALFVNILTADHKILGLFVKTLTTDHKYSPSNGENLPQSIQMQLTKKEKILSEFFVSFLKFTSIFESFQKKKKKKMTLIAYVFLKLRTAKVMVR